MKLIKIEDLKVGDEIIISCQSFFKYLKVLKKPKIDDKSRHFKSVKCSIKRHTEVVSYIDWKGNVVNYEKNSWEFTAHDHNFIQYLQLDDRDILLIKSQDYG